MAEDTGEKTQEPTPHRRQKAREEGQVAKSQDLGSAAVLLGGMLILLLLGGGIVNMMGRLARRQFGGEAWLTSEADFIVSQYYGIVFELARAVLPIFGLVLAIAVGLNVLQIGFLFVPKRLVPDPSRVNPLKGLKRLFSLSSIVRLIMGVFKILVIVAVALWSLYEEREAVLSMVELAPPQIAALIVELLIWTSIKIAVVLLLLALLDFAFQRWKQEQDMKMTTHEVREEMRILQGDPQVIARRRTVQRQLVLNRLSSVGPKADVVVTNPTEPAIAIQYDPETMLAPIVVAKGAGGIAQRIRKLALEHDITIVEKKALAQALYKEVDVNQPIPQKLFAAAAEVLAYVYRLKGKPMPMLPRTSDQDAA